MILAAYIKTIKVLKKLDSSGILLEMIAEIINKYLRQRTDTLRSIVEIVIHDEENDLKNELGQKYVRIPLAEAQQNVSTHVFQAPVRGGGHNRQ